MKRYLHHLALLTWTAAALGACASSTPAQQVVEDAATALGGRDSVMAVETVVLAGEGIHFNHGQDMRPDARGQTFTITGFERVVDPANRRMRTTLTQTPQFPYYQGQQPQSQAQGLDGTVAYNQTPSGEATRASGQTAADRQIELFHHPLMAVRAALAPDASLSAPREDGNARAVDVVVGDAAFTLVIGGDGLPVRIESAATHPNLGDVQRITQFADYQDAGGVRLPRHLTMSVDDFVVAEYRLTQHAPAAKADLAASAAVQAAPLPGAATPTVVPESIADGVWLLAGQSHHSALIEMSDHLLLVDAPQSEARTLAVIAQARELVPGKPLRTLVVSHHHFDHTAGLRAAIAEGMAVLTHEGNRAFVEEMASRPHTRRPDRLANASRTVEVTTFDDTHVIDDATREVALYHLANNPHSETMLMVHLPRERVVIQVDAFSPSSTVHPYAANLLEHIRTRKLAVERIVPLHGGVVPLTALVKAVE